ncbi:MAG: DUF4166 domain-containing protein [Alphaproteobacteria bacterium]|nr:DUF4166 domain-containing protein [Alphaproteobacteria bacterium]
MSDIYFIYDGECPMCTYAAQALRIRDAVGTLHLIDARTDKTHPLVQKVTTERLDLDEGMAIFYEDSFYHGREALHLIGMIATEMGWFNKLSALLFRSQKIARFCYPALRATRNFLLWYKGAPKIDNLDRKSIPTFQPIFGTAWDDLPPIMKKHYANRPYSHDTTATTGVMRIESSAMGRMLTPLFMLAGTLIPYEGDNIPATVRFSSDPASNVFKFDRTLHFPGKKPYRFLSRMKPVGGNELVEFMRFGLGWRMAYGWTGEKVTLTHRGYVLNIFGFLLPLPLGLFMGKGMAEETPIDDNTFSMKMEINHPLWGKVYGYSGVFTMKDEE